jgi:hypothetical protein
MAAVLPGAPPPHVSARMRPLNSATYSVSPAHTIWLGWLKVPPHPFAEPVMPMVPPTTVEKQPLAVTVGDGVGGAVGVPLRVGVGEDDGEAPTLGEGVIEGVGDCDAHVIVFSSWLSVSATRRAYVRGLCATPRGLEKRALAPGPLTFPGVLYAPASVHTTLLTVSNARTRAPRTSVKNSTVRVGASHEACPGAYTAADAAAPSAEPAAPLPTTVRTVPAVKFTARNRWPFLSTTKRDLPSPDTATLKGSLNTAEAASPSEKPAGGPRPATVVTAPVAITTARITAFAESATKSTVPAGATATPKGLLNRAAAPTAST